MSGERQFPIRWDMTGEDAIVQGSTWRRYVALEYIDPADGLTKLWDTAGFTGLMNIEAGAGQLLWVFNTSGGRLVTGIQGTAPYQYNLMIILPGSLTSTFIEWGLGRYDLFLTDVANEPHMIYNGNIVLEARVS